MAAGFELPRRMLGAYNRDLDDVSRDAVADLVDFLSDYDLEEMDLEARERLRDETIEEVLRIIDDYGDASAALGADFYETVLDVTENDGIATMPAGVDRRRVEKAVRKSASDLFGDDADLGKYADGVSTFLERVVSHRADECVAESTVAANEALARKGKKQVKKFARVPNGPSCGFCIMLASRGFVYATRKSAGELTRFHNRCDCRIVEGYDGMHVEGYDPDGMYKRYKSCRDAIRADEKDSPVRKDWDALPAEEKAKYYDPRDPKKKPSYDQYLQHRITEEMDTRDRQWLYDGTLPAIDYGEKQRERYGILLDPDLPLDQRYRLNNIKSKDTERKDLFAHDMLQRNGFNVRSRLTINQGGDENIDIDLGGFLCEVKSPEAVPNPDAEDELKFVYRDVQRARHQFEERDGDPVGMRIVLSNYYTGFGPEYEEAIFERFCHEARRQGFVEALFITKSGEVWRAI